MPKLFLILFLGIFFFSDSKSQDTTERKIIDTIYTPYKWPYMNGVIPPHFGIIGGLEGFKKGCFEIGVYHNIWEISVQGAGIESGHVGYNLLYKQNNDQSSIKSFEAEFGMFTGVILGINLNYNITPTNEFLGFKPFIGINIFNLELFYGYNFYKKSNDQENYINHNRFSVRIFIPLIKLTKAKEDRTYIYEFKDY